MQSQPMKSQPMRNQLLKISFISGALFLSGCASMSQDECVTADWNTIGYQDGARGAPSEGISRHRKACAKHGVTPNLQAYLTGWDDGVLRYCTAQSGFDAGARGQRYAGVCPVDLEDDFLMAYSDGKQLHILRSNVQQIVHQINRDEKRIKTINKSIIDKEALLISAEGEIADRVKLVAELKDLAEERGKLRKAVVELEYEHGAAQVELNHYRDDIALQYGL